MQGKGSGQGHPETSTPPSIYDTNSKTPPAWSPEWEATRPLWVYAQDLNLWSLATEVPEQRQGPLAVLQLGGMARVLGREMAHNDLVFGRQEMDQNGNRNQITGIALLLRNLLQRFGELDQEQSARILSQLLEFKRNPSEGIDAVMSRFDITVFRATNGLPNFTMGPQGIAWILLRALRVPPTMWSTLLQPLGGMLPTDDMTMRMFKRHLRAHAHLLEHHPNSAPLTGTGGGTGGNHGGGAHFVGFGDGGTDQQYDARYTTFPSWDAASSAEPSQTYATGQAWPEDDDYYDADYFGESDTDSDLDPYEDEANIAYATSLLPPGVTPNHTSILTVLYENYLEAKRRYRSFGRKQPRFQRFQGRRFHRKGKGKGKGFSFRPSTSFGKGGFGKGKGTYAVDNAWNPNQGSGFQDLPGDSTTFFKGKGKGKSGTNPIDKTTGKPMECHECGSTEHLRLKCPRLGQHHQSHATSSAAVPGAASSSSYMQSGSMYMVNLHTLDESPIYFPVRSTWEAESPATVWAQRLEDHHHERLTDRRVSGQELLRARGTPLIEEVHEQEEGFHFPWWPNDRDESEVFLLKTQLPGAREGLLIDTGAHDNLTGFSGVKRWSKLLEEQNDGRSIKWKKLNKTVSISGVGKQGQETAWAVDIPLTIDTVDGPQIQSTFTSPVVGTDEEPSAIPPLWGIRSLRRMRAVIDLVNNDIHLCGPGRVRVDLPHGSHTIKLEYSPSGHPMVPCTSQPLDPHNAQRVSGGRTFQSDPTPQ